MDIPDREEFIRGIEEYRKHEPRDAMYKVAIFLVSKFWDGKKENIEMVTNGLGVLLSTWNQAFYRYGSFNFDKLEECINRNLPKIEEFRKKNILSFSKADEDETKYLFNEFLKALQIDNIRFSDNNKKKYTKKQLEEILKAWKINYDGRNLESIYNSIKDNPKVKDAVEWIQRGKKQYIQITISKLGDSERKYLEEKKLIMRSPVAVAKNLHLLAPRFFPLWDNKIAQKYGCSYNKNPAEKYVLFCKKIKKFAEKFKDDEKIKRYEKEKSLLKLIDEYNYSKYTQGWI